MSDLLLILVLLILVAFKMFRYFSTKSTFMNDGCIELMLFKETLPTKSITIQRHIKKTTVTAWHISSKVHKK